MTTTEIIVGIVCLIGGVALQWRSRQKGAVDMQILGLMLWICGVVILMDCHWHFLTEPEH